MRKLLVEGANLLLDTIISISDITLRSRIRYRLPAKNRQKELLVLLNGPSQESILEKMDYILYDSICVNLFPLTDNFWKVKPKYYTCVDREGMYFKSSRDSKLVNDIKRTIQNLANVDWGIKLLISSNDRNSDFVQYFQKCAPKGEIVFVNIAHIAGYEWWRNFALRYGLGVFTSRNVSVPAISFGVQMGYQKISILGMDHDWLTQIRVDKVNRIIINDRHFTSSDENDKNWDVRYHDLLNGFEVIFRAHYYLSKYSTMNSIEIRNYNLNSMVDSYIKCQL